jgi:hypothetical protein
MRISFLIRTAQVPFGAVVFILGFVVLGIPSLLQLFAAVKFVTLASSPKAIL